MLFSRSSLWFACAVYYVSPGNQFAISDQMSAAMHLVASRPLQPFVLVFPNEVLYLCVYMENM